MNSSSQGLHHDTITTSTTTSIGTVTSETLFTSPNDDIRTTDGPVVASCVPRPSMYHTTPLQRHSSPRQQQPPRQQNQALQHAMQQQASLRCEGSHPPLSVVLSSAAAASARQSMASENGGASNAVGHPYDAAHGGGSEAVDGGDGEGLVDGSDAVRCGDDGLGNGHAGDDAAEDGGDENDTSVAECRICRDGDGPLVFACRCNSLVHPACLRRWLGYRADALFPLLSVHTVQLCEICRHPLRPSALSANSPTTANATTAESRGGGSNGSSSGVGTKYDACLLLPRVIANSVGRWCETALTLEGCLFLFLFVLAVMGHALFVLAVYKGAEGDEHSLKRVALAAANAAVTLSLLLVVQKVAARWLREAELGVGDGGMGGGQPQVQQQGGEDVEVGVGGGGVVSQRLGDVGFAGRWTTWMQVALGAFLSVVAAAEIFFLVRELPLGGLA